ncbi:hypothetical protein DITRI_Ditri17bG0079100 [Diplodiscus trichospermus]
MNSRGRLLHTCGVSAFAMVRKASIKAQDMNEPLGSMAKKIVTLGSLFSSLLCALQHCWLAIFSYIDDCVLALEDAIERVFPPSKHVFIKVDDLVTIIETLPGKFDDVLDRFPVIIEQVPLLDWALGQAISWLKVLTSILTHWDSGNTKEKEIVVDTGHNESNGVSAAAAADHEAKHPTEISPSQVGLNNKVTFPSVSEKPETESENVGEIAKASSAKGITYKEVLERGKRENFKKKKAKKNGNNNSANVVKIEEAEEQASKKEDVAEKNDSILDLFDSGWLTNIPVKRAINSSLPRSVSYT